MPSRHAEMDALNKVKSLKNMPRCVDILVIRYTKSGVLSESRPCFHCIKSLQKSKINIRYVYYSTRFGTIVRENFNRMENSPLTYISSRIRNMIKNKESSTDTS